MSENDLLNFEPFFELVGCFGSIKPLKNSGDIDCDVTFANTWLPSYTDVSAEFLICSPANMILKDWVDAQLRTIEHLKTVIVEDLQFSQDLFPRSLLFLELGFQLRFPWVVAEN